MNTVIQRPVQREGVHSMRCCVLWPQFVRLWRNSSFIATALELPAGSPRHPCARSPLPAHVYYSSSRAMHGNGAAGTRERTSPNCHTAFHNTRPLVWVFGGLRCSRVSPRWFVFASTSCLEIQHVWVVWGLSDLLGCRNSDRKPRWVMICYKTSGEILVFTFIQWKVSHRCRPAV